jgi:PAS domain S-box-containing protein
MTALLVDRTLGGLMLRRLLPAAILIPIALTWLHLLSKRVGLLENDTGEALFALVQVVIFAGLIWWYAGLLRRTDTDRIQVEAALRLSEERFEKAFRASPEALVISHMATGQIIEVNERWDQIFGFSPEETVGQSSLALKLFENPVDRQRAVDIIRTQGSLRDFELTVRPKSGRQRHISISAEMMEIDNERCLLTMIADITERKQAEAEVRRLNQELEQRVVERTAQLEAANKELEAFAYSVSHDLRAPLRSIDGFSQALLEDYAGNLDAEGQRFLQRVRAASQRMAQLIDDLLALSRITRSEMIFQSVNLSTIASKVAEELRQSDPERQVEFVIAEELAVYGDARLLQVAVENLLGNAWKFTGNHARARIEVGAVEQAGQTVYFVRDDGAGFDMAYADKLFGAFQRLHGMNEFPGTGIGLATVQRVIHRHGGQIWAEGGVEKGATFYFTLEKER